MAQNELLYPLRFKEILRDYGFGGRWIVEAFDKEGLPENHRVAETWETVDRPCDSSEIINGPLAGKTLHDAIEAYGEALLGTDIVARCGMRYPLLIKFLDASNVLGEQLHPNDEQAEQALQSMPEQFREARQEDTGKTEAWYMLRAKPDATVHACVKSGVTREQFEQALLNGTTKDLMVERPVKVGDGFLLHAGMVHYAKGGVIFAEIMQNSDITVGLGPRSVPDDLPEAERAAKAKELAAFVHLEDGDDPLTKQVALDMGDGNTHTYIFACRYFLLERFDLAAPLDMAVDGQRFYVLMQIEGESAVTCGDTTAKLRCGQSCLIPAASGSARVEPGPGAAILRVSFPDLSQDVVAPLRAAGCTDEQIAGLGGKTVLNDIIPLL